MAKVHFAIWVSVIAAVAALPTDPIRKLSPERYQYVVDDEEVVHLADMWETVADLEEMMRFNPDATIQYHLYTRQNPTLSQVLVYGNQNLLANSNFRANRRTVVTIHGWNGRATSAVNTNIISAYLDSEDVNAIVVDWSAGAVTINYIAAIGNTVTAGQSVARFLTWLNQASGANPGQYHIAGHSLGGQMSGIVSRNMNRQIAYITSLDPAMPGWITHSETFKADDGQYTEVIHTNAGALGFLTTLGHADFYPNGGVDMPGCGNINCSHSRAYYYIAESIRSGGFTSQRCASYLLAIANSCNLGGNVRMGGALPKTGTSGVFWLQTNAGPPFSRG